MPAAHKGAELTTKGENDEPRFRTLWRRSPAWQKTYRTD